MKFTGQVFISTPEDTGPAHTQMQIQLRFQKHLDPLTSAILDQPPASQAKFHFTHQRRVPHSRLPAMPSTRELANVSVLAVTTAAGWCLWMLMRKPVSYSFDNHNGVCQLRLSSFGRCRGHNLLGDPEWSGGGSDATNSSCVDTASVWQRKCGSTVNVIHTWTPSISLELSLAACTVSGHSTRRLASTSRVSLTPHTSGFPIAGYRYRLAHCSSMNAARATAR